MTNSKLLHLCKSLRNEEHRWLRDFAQSPYFNKNPLVTKLVLYLVKQATRGYPESALRVAVVWGHIYPGKAVDERVFRHLMSRTLKLVEHFLTIHMFERDEISYQQYALKTFAQRKLKQCFKTTERHLQSELQARPHSRELMLANFHYLHTAEQYFVSQNLRTRSPYLQELADQLDDFYLTQKLRLHCEMAAYRSVTGEEFDLKLPELLQVLPKQHPLANLYYQTQQLLARENDEVALQKLLKALDTSAATIDKNELQDVYYYCSGYCAQQIRFGHRNFISILLNIYQSGLTKGYLIDNDQLSPWVYKNIIRLSLGLKQFEWVDAFIDQYSTYLPEAQRKDAINYNKADLAFYRGDFKTAMLLINEVEFSDIYYKFGAKEMLIKIYFLEQEEEAFESLCFAFRMMLKRERKLSGTTKSAYVNFIQLAQKVYKFSNQGDANQAEKLRKIIVACDSLTSRQWLVEQISQQTSPKAY